MPHCMPWGWSWLTQDNAIVQGPIEVLSVVVTPTAAAVADVTFRHGLGTGEPVALVVRTASGESLALSFPAPVLFDRGLFADMGSNVAGVLVIWRPWWRPREG